jgi:hypothetical protein
MSYFGRFTPHTQKNGKVKRSNKEDQTSPSYRLLFLKIAAEVVDPEFIFVVTDFRVSLVMSQKNASRIDSIPFLTIFFF